MSAGGSACWSGSIGPGPGNPLDTLGFLLEAIGFAGFYFLAITGFSGLVWIIPILRSAGLDTRGIDDFLVWLGTLAACVGLVIGGNRIRRAASR